MEGWTLQRVVRRAAEVLRQEGAKSLLFKALGETVYRRVVLVERLLDEPVSEVIPRVPVAIDLLRGTEVGEYCTFLPGTDPVDIRRRLEDGQWCFVARHEGRMVHVCWVAAHRAWIDYLSREIHLAPDEVYVYESYTLPGFRGQNIAPARATRVVRFFQDAGYRRAVAVIVPENRVAFRPSQKTDYRPFGVMGYVQIGPWKHRFCRVHDGVSPINKVQGAHGAAYWDRIGLELEGTPHYLDPFLGELKRQAYLDLIRRWGDVPVRGLVLKTDLFEEAMGPDAFLQDLSNGSGSSVGMDVSAAIVRQARLQDESGKACYVAADVRHLPFANGSLTLIVSPSTLDHFSDPLDLGRSLRELGRILVSGGRLIITLDNRENVFDPLLRLAARFGQVPYYLGRSYSVAELCTELEAAGFKVQETAAILHNPRLVAVAAVSLANKLRWSWLASGVQRTLLAAQRLEGTRWRYRTGSFVAALAIRRGSSSEAGASQEVCQG